jgi:hypothetical protein
VEAYIPLLAQSRRGGGFTPVFDNAANWLFRFENSSFWSGLNLTLLDTSGNLPKICASIVDLIPAEYFGWLESEYERKLAAKSKGFAKRMEQAKISKSKLLKTKLLELCRKAEVVQYLSSEEFDDLFQEVRDTVYLENSVLA